MNFIMLLCPQTQLTLQMTPSQSKMKTSTPGNKSFPGSVNFRTLALSAVVEEEEEREEAEDIMMLPPLLPMARTAGESARWVVAAGEKARAEVDARARASADLAMFIVQY